VPEERRPFDEIMNEMIEDEDRQREDQSGEMEGDEW